MATVCEGQKWGLCRGCGALLLSRRQHKVSERESRAFHAEGLQGGRERGVKSEVQASTNSSVRTEGMSLGMLR